MKQYLSRLTTVLLLAVVCTINAKPQPQQQDVDPANPDIQRVINEVFSTQATPNRGFGVVVTPDPTFVPTTAPQTMLNGDNQQCTCVPYHMCDPSNNTVRETDEDDAITGFGLIDIRFDPLDCQDVLDVCCIGAKQREQPIVPVTPPDTITRAAGCGIRNVGGLDFQITGAFVSLYHSIVSTKDANLMHISIAFSGQRSWFWGIPMDSGIDSYRRRPVFVRWLIDSSQGNFNRKPLCERVSVCFRCRDPNRCCATSL